MSRIVNYNIEQECNLFLRNKVQDWESVYQSKAIPIPKFPQASPDSATFIGSLAREVLRLTDPKTTLYVEQMWAWYDAKTQDAVLTSRIMPAIHESIGTAGLFGLRRILGFMIVRELQVS
jgi:WASH complex subunit strumpellin